METGKRHRQKTQAKDTGKRYKAVQQLFARHMCTHDAAFCERDVYPPVDLVRSAMSLA